MMGADDVIAVGNYSQIVSGALPTTAQVSVAAGAVEVIEQG